MDMEGSGNVGEAELGCSLSTSVSSSILAPSACSSASRVSREALLDCLSAKAQEGHKMTAGSKWLKHTATSKAHLHKQQALHPAQNSYNKKYIMKFRNIVRVQRAEI